MACIVWSLRVLIMVCTFACLGARAQTALPMPDPSKVEIHDMVEGRGALAALGTIAVVKLQRWNAAAFRSGSAFQDPRTIPAARALAEPTLVGYGLAQRDQPMLARYIADGIVGMRQGGRRVLVIRAVTPDYPQLFDIELVDVGATQAELKARNGYISFAALPETARLGMPALHAPIPQVSGPLHATERPAPPKPTQELIGHPSCDAQDQCSDARLGTGRALAMNDYARISLHELRDDTGRAGEPFPLPGGSEYVYELKPTTGILMDDHLVRAMIGMRVGGIRQVTVSFASVHRMEIQLRAIGSDIADFGGASDYVLVHARPTEARLLASKPGWTRCSTGPLCRDVSNGTDQASDLLALLVPGSGAAAPKYARVAIRRWRYQPDAPDFKGALIGEADPPDYALPLAPFGGWKVSPRISAAVLDMKPDGQRILALPEVGMTVQVTVHAVAQDVAGLGDPALYQMLPLPDRKAPDSADVLMHFEAIDLLATTGDSARETGGSPPHAAIGTEEELASGRRAWQLARYAEVIRIYRPLAQRGNQLAQQRLGQVYKEGLGVAKDPAQAQRYFAEAASNAEARAVDPGAMYALATMYDAGDGLPQDHAKAVAWYRKAAEAGDVDAQISLALSYDQRHGSLSDARLAFAWMRRAAQQGSPIAQLGLSRYYTAGRGVGMNLEDAAAWCSKSAEQGYAPAEKVLGDLYADGTGVPQNAATAVVWYRKAAEQGNANGQLRLGQSYQFGKGVPQDDGEARAWYTKAAAQEQTEAQNNLARMLESGWGGPKDEAEALRLYRIVAGRNNRYGQYNLGRMYALGNKVLARDERQAAIWTRKAADQGMPDAKYALAMFYRDGIGVTRDVDRAMDLLKEAARDGQADALEYLHALNPPPPRTIIIYMPRPMPVIW